jgi:hypothetical protein
MPASVAAAALARWPVEPYLRGMTTDDLRAIAQRMLKRMIHEHPDAASEIAAMVLTELLAVCLFGDDEAGVTAFADAVNTKLDEIALHHGASTSWRLTRAERPRRH